MQMTQTSVPTDRGTGLLVDEERGWRHQLAYVGKLLWRDKSGVLGLTLFLLIVLAAVFAPVIAPYDPLEQNLAFAKTPPGWAVNPKEARQVIETAFSVDELRALSSGLNVDYDGLLTFDDTADEKAKVLVDTLDDEGRISEMVENGRQLRPDLDWPERKFFLLGTDNLGRDMFSRIIYGTRVSLTVGFFGVLIAGSMGMVIGLVAGYVGGRVDNVIMGFINLILALPYLLFVVVIASILGRSLLNVILIFGITDSPIFARTTRGEVLRIRESGYVESAVSIGVRRWRILFDHILPYLIGPLVTVATFEMSGMIFYEAGLGFLGLSVPPSVPSWGNMLSAGRKYLTTSPWIATFPGFAIMLTSLAMNLLGDWLRDVLDPRLRRTER
jgi:ABC-type dipeptide/oligopeptide/nickel transport system permease subunit